VVALTHKYGCAAGSEGEAIDLLRRTIAGYARHPNFAAVLIVGLGCEANQLGRLAEAEGLPVGDRIHPLVIQEEGGTTATAKRGAAIIRELLPDANRVTRQAVPARHLTLGLAMRRLDGFSGITANPALGAAADLLVRNGGTAILSETPVIYGAEHLLLASGGL
jgi:altronate hydrolase